MTRFNDVFSDFYCDYIPNYFRCFRAQNSVVHMLDFLCCICGCVLLMLIYTAILFVCFMYILCQKMKK